MKPTLGKVLGLILIVSSVACVFVATKIIHSLGGKVTYVVPLACLPVFSLGWYLLLGNNPFPTKEDSEQPPWRDEDPSQ